MLLSQRIAGLQRLEVQLRRLVKEDAVCSANIFQHPCKNMDRRGAVRRSAIKDKLLFRKVPIALSLLERSLFSLIRHEKLVANTAAKADGSFLSGEDPIGRAWIKETQLIGSNASVNIVNKANMLQEVTQTALGTLSPQQQVIRRPVCMSRLFCALHFMEQERRKLYSHRMNKLQSKLLAAESAACAAQKRRENTAALTAARQAVSNAKADIRLLQGSLLSRPFLSARLWRLLLREEIWVAAVRDSRQVNNDSPSASSVIVMLLSLTRIGFGALRDVVAQGHSLNTRAPRFVASLPSLKMRQQVNKKEHAVINDKKGIMAAAKAATEHDAVVENEDPMLIMMMTSIVAPQTEQAVLEKSVLPQKTRGQKHMFKKLFASKDKSNIVQLRWLPPSSCDVVPLVVETLAMCSHVLQSIDVANVVTSCGLAQEFFEVLSVLQATASALLAICGDGNSGDLLTHQTLHRLEDAMLNCGENARRSLISQGPDLFLSFSPVKAARLLLGLESMKLLCANEHASCLLIMQLVIRIFPQLSTGTQRTLLEKSRQSTLFAFATRGQRMKLRREHGKYGIRAALLSSVRSRARLQQRQMQAALRANHLEEVNQRSVRELAENLSMYSLITLFDLLVRAARDSAQCEPDAQSRLITAAIFAVDSVFLAAANTTSCGDCMFHVGDLTTLLVSLSVFWPLVAARYQTTRQSLGDLGRNHIYYKRCFLEKKNSVSDSIAKSELFMVSQVIDMVFTAVNAALAERVEGVESILGSHTEANRVYAVTAKDVVGIVNALFEWCGISLNHRNVTFVETSARLIKRLLVADVQLWQELRLLSENRRDQFVRMLSDVLRRLEMMDTVVSQALSAVC